MATTIIKNGYLLDPSLPFEQGDILIKDDLITQIAPEIDFPADTIISALDKIVLPGLISAHCHTFSTPQRGLIDNLPLDIWLLYVHYAYTLLGKHSKISSRELYVFNSIAAVELLKTGTTSLLEHGPIVFPPDFGERLNATVNAFADVGIRAVVAPLSSDLKYSEQVPLYLLGELKPEDISPLNLRLAPETDDIIKALRRSLKDWQDRNSRISLCLGPGRVNMCSRELMEQTVELASEFDVGIHTHLASAKAQVLWCNKVLSQSMVQYLASINCLGPHVSLAHGIWLDENDIQTLADTNSSVIHNPISNLKLGSGIAPIQAMKARGVNVALGVDDIPCNDAQNMFEVMKYTALIHKLYGSPSEWIGAQDAFTMCLTGGAKVLRKKIGSLQPGYLADLVILGTETLFIMPKENFINQLVFSESGSSVETVLVGGRIVVEDKKVKTVNEKELYTEAREIIQKMYMDIPSVKKRFAPAEDLLKRLDTVVADYELPFTRWARI